jgi:hypothetical protein
MVTGIKRNFSTQFNNNITCEFCQVDCQEHLLKCVELSKHVKIPADVEYGDLFKDTVKQQKIVKIFK